MEYLLVAVIVGFAVTDILLCLIIHAIGDLRALISMRPWAPSEEAETVDGKLRRIRDQVDEIRWTLDDAFGLRELRERGRAYTHLCSIEQAVKNSRRAG